MLPMCVHYNVVNLANISAIMVSNGRSLELRGVRTVRDDAVGPGAGGSLSSPASTKRDSMVNSGHMYPPRICLYTLMEEEKWAENSRDAG